MNQSKRYPEFESLPAPVLFVETSNPTDGFGLRVTENEVLLPCGAGVNVYDTRGTLLRRLGVGIFGDGESRYGDMYNIRGPCASGDVVFAADADAHRICAVRKDDGGLVRVFGSYGASDGYLSSPSGVALHGGLVWVADSDNDRISVFREDGQFVRTFGLDDHHRGLKGPLGIVATDGELYVADSGNHRVCVFSVPDGTLQRTFGRSGSGAGEIGEPEDVYVTGGLAYVADRLNQRIAVFGVDDGRHVAHVAMPGPPVGVCVSASGVLYASCGSQGGSETIQLQLL